MYLIFDTETTGLPKNWNAPITDSDNWPRCIQLAWQIHDELGELIEVKNFIIKPEGFDIPFNASKIHGISTERALKTGQDLKFVLNEFNESLKKTKFVIGHNVNFDLNIVGAEFHRAGIESPMMEMNKLDSCSEKTATLCQIPGGRGGKFKLPKLQELHLFLFNEEFAEAHNASADVEATTRCFLELIRKKVYSIQELEQEQGYFEKFQEKNPELIKLLGLNIKPYGEEDLIEEKVEKDSGKESTETLSKSELSQLNFSHLHNHSQFSILQSTSDINSLVKAAAANNMSGIALTDTGNMMGAFHFVKAVNNHNKGVRERNEEQELKSELEKELKPIVGCEFFVCNDHKDKSHKDNGAFVVILAKNKNGYHNLAKLSSKSNIDGFYYVPRIDKKLIEEFKEDLIILSGGVRGELANLILNVGEKQAEESLIWWKEQFGDDFYIELVRHGEEEENHANAILIELAKKHQVKLVAANNTFYIAQDQAEAHDVLLCIRDGEKKSTPIGRGREFRYGMPNDEFYFKSQPQMVELFKDVPQAIASTQEIVDTVEAYILERDVLLPKFDIPEEFKDPEDELDKGTRGENNYLRDLTYKGAHLRYGEELTEEQTERIDFELSVIANTGYPGYFLIVQDFIQAARDMDVSVGPGRGSAAGSVVAYCLKITNIDPLKYNLLFERFLNPDRVSMPDIDIDFDDEGRGRVIDWVIDKYGSQQVAQIITYGTMAAKSSIRDTSRALDLPLMEAGRLANLIPNTKLSKIFGMEEKALAKKLGRKEDMDMAMELKAIAKGDTLEAEVINQAIVLEGSVRNTGTHACGVIITPGDITNYVPVATAKDSDMYVTQFDNSVVEDAGLLKMDFLGLKTLTLIKDTVKIVKAIHNVDLDPEAFDLEDEKTYELFQKGETVGVFQYESAGMQKYLKDLKPTVFDDLIAMNALYRPGPLEYIPSFVKRKNGEEEIVYDIAASEEYLAETYGITVYQEQVMLLSQKLANFTKGEADVLRKAMGKKIFALLEKLKPKFIEGGKSNGHDEDALNKIWKDWEAFAAYAFNKSHSTCYAWVAFQTAYLKAHYPAEYMASVLSNNMNDIKSVTFFMEECKRMGIEVLGPDVNESYFKFAVNESGAIRFGMGAIKGVGEGAVESIINTRKEEGKFSSIFDLTSKIDLRAANKRTLESLAIAGGFDSFEGGVHRAQYVTPDVQGRTTVETAIKYGNAISEGKNSNQGSLFDTGDGEVNIPEPIIALCEEWGSIEALNREKELVGIFISGHPLDDFKFEIDNFCGSKVDMLNQMHSHVGKEISLGCIINNVEHRVAKNGNPFGTFEIEDYDGSFKQFLFKEDYLKFKHFLVNGNFVYVRGRIDKKRWGDMEPMFVINSIELLSEIRDKQSKSLTLTLPIRVLNNEFIDNLHGLLEPGEEEEKGNCKLKVIVTDEKKTAVNLFSRKMKIKITNEMLSTIDEMDGVSYKLN
ncbi:MAG: DNA polymerase III subunit alpha [Flavobacteriales bacterium]|nr:DNA polymerase III subunit alpha [Flavobacteriales bacterium]